jgi:hypothetical protein
MALLLLLLNPHLLLVVILEAQVAAPAEPMDHIVAVLVHQVKVIQVAQDHKLATNSMEVVVVAQVAQALLD